MKNIINYAKTTRFLGRNGMFKQSGLFIGQTDEDIYLHPITSKGEVGRSFVTIPKEQISEVIDTLKNIEK